MDRSLRQLCSLLALTFPSACTTERTGSPLRPDYDMAAEERTEQVVSQFSGNREFGLTFSSGFRNDTLTRVLVTVSRNADSTFLTYDVSKCPFSSPPCFSVERGFGLIPGSDLAATGNGGLRLSTNTQADANPSFQRTAGAGGEIVVTWVRELGGDFQDTNGRSTFMLGPEFTRTAGQVSSTTAVVSGSVVGTDVNQGSRQALTTDRAGITVQVVRAQ